MRRLAWVPLIGMAWVAGPHMGMRLALPAAGSGSAPRLRIMSYNVDGQTGNPRVALEVLKADPDVICFQEGGWSPPQWLPGWNGSKIIARSIPVENIENRIMPESPAWRNYQRGQIDLEGRKVTLVNLHLDTPRSAIAHLRHTRLRGTRYFEEDSAARVFRAAGIRREITEKDSGPLIVAGDFNAPEPSLVCRTFLHMGLRDAFSEAGTGYGYTVGQRLWIGLFQSYVRIDHIMVSPHWRVLRCWTGGDAGNTHRPVIADLELRPAAAD
jgi:vancomycin resistance protein VanJ